MSKSKSHSASSRDAISGMEFSARSLGLLDDKFHPCSFEVCTSGDEQLPLRAASRHAGHCERHRFSHGCLSMAKGNHMEGTVCNKFCYSHSAKHDSMCALPLIGSRLQCRQKGADVESLKSWCMSGVRSRCLLAGYCKQ